jgi:hypothetical protein
VPDPDQKIAVGGPLLERLIRSATLLAIQILRVPLRALTLPLKQLRHEVMSLRAAAVESLAYVGVELRRLQTLIEQGGVAGPGASAEPRNARDATSVVELPFVFRSLAAIEPSGPVLVAGGAGREVGASLRSLGYEVTEVGEVPDDWDEEPRFQAVVWIGQPAQPGAADVKRLGRVLADGGILVMGLTFGLAVGNGASARYDEASLNELLANWTVAERVVVERNSDEGWVPVRNGVTAERGVALIVAKRADLPS